MEYEPVSKKVAKSPTPKDQRSPVTPKSKVDANVVP